MHPGYVWSFLSFTKFALSGGISAEPFLARWTARYTPFCRVFRRCDIIVPPNVSARFPFFPLPLFHLGLSLVLFPLFCTQQRRAISISILVCLVFFLHVYT